VNTAPRKHHQQADQIRRERQTRQGAAFTFDARTHGALQGGRQAVEPVAQLRQWLRHLGQRLRQRGRGFTKAPDLLRTQQVDGADGQGHGQRDGAGADKAPADPDHGN